MPTGTAIAWEIDVLEPQDLTETPTPTPPAICEEIPSKASGREAEVVQRELEAEIERSKDILQLADDWDGEESSGYSPVTLNRAIAFLKTHSAGLWRSYGARLPIPTIGPGPAGSIDIYWKRRTWELLVNIPPTQEEPATFYGNDYGSQKIKGSFDPTKYTLGIAIWLMT
jgi:hypothetical protein